MRLCRRIISSGLAAAALLLLLLTLQRQGSPPPGLEDPLLQTIRLVSPAGRMLALSVERADEEAERQRGLMFRPVVEHGMLFVFPRAAPHRFWMYRCLIPLDIVWLDAEARVVHIESGLPICPALPCADYGPSENALYVLEIGAGVAARRGIRGGQRLELIFSSPPRPS